MRIDAIEKEPLFHFHPGARVLRPGFLKASGLASEAHRGSAQCVALPADPGPQVPQVQAALRACRDRGLLTIGSITAQSAAEGRGVPLEALDAATIELAGETDTQRLRSTLRGLRKVVARTTTWIELSVRVVRDQTDSHLWVDHLSQAIEGELGPDVPLHLDALVGQVEAMSGARWIAVSSGLHWVYMGSADNASGRSTWCPGCHSQLIARGGSSITMVCLADGRCSSCGRPVPGRFAPRPVALQDDGAELASRREG